MTSTIFIRKAVTNDVEKLSGLAVRSKAHWGYSTEFMLACRQELLVTPQKLMMENFQYSVGLLNKNIVGYYALENLFGGVFELEALFVEPRVIGTGIGKVLMQHAIQLATSKGGQTLIIQGDPHAEGFYLAAGAKLSGKRESASIPGRELPVYTLSLNHHKFTKEKKS